MRFERTRTILAFGSEGVPWASIKAWRFVPGVCLNQSSGIHAVCGSPEPDMSTTTRCSSVIFAGETGREKAWYGDSCILRTFTLIIFKAVGPPSPPSWHSHRCTMSSVNHMPGCVFPSSLRASHRRALDSPLSPSHSSP